tara:strand:- start:203 stop:439 length:237 start_codon:yes stop_codon:yes gene_type:complete
VFIRVKIDNLNELSRLIPEIVNNDDKINNDKMNTTTEIKNLLIFAESNVDSENSSLLTKIFKGLACEISSLIENLKRE